MNGEQIDLIRRSFEQISTEGLAESFYDHLFSIQPALRLLFPDDFGEQKEKLLLMLGAAIEMLDEPEKLIPVLEESGRRHALYGAREEHYATVGAALLEALRESIAADFTPETEAAWTRLYEEMSETMKRGARRLAAALEQRQEKKTAEKIDMKIQNATVNMIRIFLMAVMLGFISVVTANAETVFVADLNGIGVAPPADSTGRGFAAVVLNDSETEVDCQVFFSNLHSNSTSAAIHFPGGVGENVPPGIHIAFANGWSTIGWASGTVPLTPEMVQHLKNGLWYIQINSTGFPSGEIRGQFRPYSPYIANMDSLQTVPDGASAATGAVYMAVSKDERTLIYYYKYSEILNRPAKLSILSGTPGLNGTWMMDATNPDSAPSRRGIGYRQLGEPGNSFVTPLKKGLLYAVVTTEADFPRGEIRGQIKPMNKTTDFEGDGRSDISVYREATGVWYQIRSLDNGVRQTQFGLAGDLPAHADYDGDGITDIAVHRATAGQFYVLRSKDRVVQVVRWGQTGDRPAPADFDGDGKADYVISRQSGQNKVFWMLGSLNNSVRTLQWGLDGDQFLPADFDGDRVNDLTVYRPSNQTFYSILSLTNTYRFQKWGIPGDIPKIGDFDGDGKSEYAIYRPAGAGAGAWWTLYTTGVSTVFNFGLAGDRPVPSDYDGDGKTDFAIYRDGDWWIRKSTNGSISVTRFGLATDTTTTY
jgi:hemoglobin-like flavoprotein